MNFAFDEQVDTVTEFKNDAVVFDWKWFFGLERHVKTLQFVAETRPVRPFEKPRTELGMHSVRGVQDVICDAAVNELNTVSSVRIRVLRVSAFRKQTAGRV